MTYKKFAILILFALYGCLALLVLTNVVVDPYEIFQTHLLKRQLQTNLRYSKIEFLKTRKGKYDSYILGSSRMFNTRPEVVMKYLPGASFYNLATMMATPYEHLLHLRYLIEHGYPLKHLYIGLDIDFCFQEKMHDARDLLLKLHPDVMNRSRIGYYWDYALSYPRKDILRQLNFNFSKRTEPVPIFGEDGALAEEESEDGGGFFANPSKNDLKPIGNEVGEGNVESLKEMEVLCRQKGIDLILFINPHHHSFVGRFVVEDYSTFLRRLSEITPFWDFSGYNSVTTHNKNYWDVSHYKSSVSRMIAARIFGDRAVMVPEDFGVRVTKDNVAAHIEQVKEKFREITIPDLNE